MLLKERDIQLSREADVFSNEERTVLLNRAMLLTKRAFYLVCQDELHNPDNPIFDCSVIIEWFDQLRKWAHFNSAYYSDIRMKEVELAKTLAIKTLHLAQECLLELGKIGSFYERESKFAPTIK